TFDSFIAGGAIANLIHEYINQVPAKINDIDFFYYQFDDTHEITERTHYQELYANIDTEDPRCYSIVKLEEDKKINKIRILPDSTFGWYRLLEQFDLNCCQAGIDLFNEQIYVTSHFINFLKNKEIKILNDNRYPLTSIVRGITKAKELQSNFFLHDNIRDF